MKVALIFTLIGIPILFLQTPINLVALISALTGVSIWLFLSFVLISKIANPWLRSLSIVFIFVAVIGGAGVVIPTLFSNYELSTMLQTAEYELYLGVLYITIRSLFFKKANKKTYLRLQ